MKSNHKIIWAADPFEDKATRGQAIQVLRELSKRMGVAVEPVYVLSDGLLRVSASEEKLVRDCKPASKRALDKLVKSAKVGRLRKAKILAASSSQRSVAAVLDRYAQQTKADFILVNSHGRKGLARALLGSFAETLTLRSKTPILISGPKTGRISKLDHILFPTDFSPASKKAFQKIQQFAKKLGARITLFHAVLNPVEPFAQSAAMLVGGGFFTTQDYTREVHASVKKVAVRWVGEAKKNGFQVEAVFDVGSASVMLSVLEYARNNHPGLIAMASESGAVSTALLGSIGRGVAREAPCPVLFMRS